jgi:hypothetical protein
MTKRFGAQGSDGQFYLIGIFRNDEGVEPAIELRLFDGTQVKRQSKGVYEIPDGSRRRGGVIVLRSDEPNAP